MKARIFALLIVLMFGITIAEGQVLNKQYIDNWITSTFPYSQVNNNTTYILNGNLLDSIGFVNMSSVYSAKDVSSINYIDSNLLNNLNPQQPVSAIILISTEKQDKETIKTILNRCQSRYTKYEIASGNIDVEKGEPVLVVNDKQIDFRECYDLIHKIKESNVVNINHIEQPVSESLYGANAENGLILIRTKKKVN